LNRRHGVQRTEKFWNIFVGGWLVDFIGIFLDRYLSIRAAAETGRVEMVLLPPSAHEISSSADIASYQAHYVSTPFNDHLFGYLIRKLRPFPFRELDLACNSSAMRPPVERPPAKRVIAAIWHAISKITPNSTKQVVIVTSYLSSTDLLKLSLQIGQLPALDIGGLLKPGTRCDEAARMNIKLTLGDTEFERLLAELIPFHLPSSVVEDFAQLQKTASKSWSRNASVIFSANICGASDCFRLWAATQKEAGGTILLHQHGGNMGTARCSAFEDHDIDIADNYYTWGWTKGGLDKVRPLPSAKLMASAARIRIGRANGILVNGDTVPRRFYRFASMPIGHQVMDLHEGYVRFFRTLSAFCYKRSVLRLYPWDWGWDEERYYCESLPGLRVYRGAQSFYQQLNEVSLFVCGSNQTTFLETLAANFPTIIFLDPRLWEIRPEAEPYFDELKRVGIFHSSPESAADFVNRISSEPQLWWEEHDVQTARRRFSSRFAWVSSDWTKKWVAEIEAALCQ
jgi:putative transferase (TIGR04331 family)